MKRLISMLLLFALVLSLLPGAALAAEDDYTGKTVILCTGSIRGEIQLYPRIKAWKDDYLAKGADVILADCGNFLQGRTWANSDRGAGVYRLMDEAGYDVANLGLAEFGYTDATAGYVYHGNFTRYYTQAMLQDGTEAVTYAKNRDGSVTDTLPARKKAGTGRSSSLHPLYSLTDAVIRGASFIGNSMPNNSVTLLLFIL